MAEAGTLSGPFAARSRPRDRDNSGIYRISFTVGHAYACTMARRHRTLKGRSAEVLALNSWLEPEDYFIDLSAIVTAVSPPASHSETTRHHPATAVAEGQLPLFTSEGS
jgi:hypothetical protein